MRLKKTCCITKYVIWRECGKPQKPQAAYPSYFAEGLQSPSDERKEGDAMITYQDFFLFCTFVVALISLLVQIFKGKK